MAMNGTNMGTQIWSAIKATTGAAYSPSEDAAAQAIWEAVANAIVTHIQSNAVVPSGITVATTGSPGSHTGTTTGPGTVT